MIATYHHSVWVNDVGTTASAEWDDVAGAVEYEVILENKPEYCWHVL
ncbi:MAG: hypothetical protein R2792_19750 [Saprospiraceae bacterium]